MKGAALALLFALTVRGSDREGLPPRTGPDSYPFQSRHEGLIIAAEPLSADQVRSTFSTGLADRYLVFEVAFYPSKGTETDIDLMDLGLRLEGYSALIRPATAETISRMIQKRAVSRSRDVVLYPSVGVGTGSWGTQTGAGVGVGVGGNAPGPAHTDRDRDTMQAELEDKGLQEGRTAKPVAGYVYFPLGSRKLDSRKKARPAELIYSAETGEVCMPTTLP